MLIGRHPARSTYDVDITFYRRHMARINNVRKSMEMELSGSTLGSVDVYIVIHDHTGHLYSILHDALPF